MKITGDSDGPIQQTLKPGCMLSPFYCSPLRGSYINTVALYCSRIKTGCPWLNPHL